MFHSMSSAGGVIFKMAVHPNRLYFGMVLFISNFRFNAGSGTVLVLSEFALSRNKWYSIELIRVKNYAEMNINIQHNASSQTAGKNTFLNLDKNFYLGGLRSQTET